MPITWVWLYYCFARYSSLFGEKAENSDADNNSPSTRIIVMQRPRINHRTLAEITFNVSTSTRWLFYCPNLTDFAQGELWTKKNCFDTEKMVKMYLFVSIIQHCTTSIVDPEAALFHPLFRNRLLFFLSLHSPQIRLLPLSKYASLPPSPPLNEQADWSTPSAWKYLHDNTTSLILFSLSPFPSTLEHLLT